jgi:hypothetical protein
VAVSFEEPPPLDLGEPAQPFDLEQLRHALQLGEVLLDACVRKLR